jgi:hypothetical protein
VDLDAGLAAAVLADDEDVDVLRVGFRQAVHHRE